jgi:hypothetical protein
MSAAPKSIPLWKLHCRVHLACRACPPEGEADTFREETGKGTGETLRGRGLSAHARTVEIMSGRANSRQGLTTTCKDSSE